MEAPEFKITLVVNTATLDYLEGTRSLLHRIVDADRAAREAEDGPGRAWITQAYAREARRLLDVLHTAPADAWIGGTAADEAARTWFDDQGNPILLDSAEEVLARRKAAILELAELRARVAAQDARGVAPAAGAIDRPAGAPAAPTRDPGAPDESADLWADSVCAACEEADCFGECPGYPEYERRVIAEEAARQADRLARPTALPSSDALARAHEPPDEARAREVVDLIWNATIGKRHGLTVADLRTTPGPGPAINGSGLAPGATVETPDGPAPAAVGPAPWCARCDGYHVPGCRC